jgi:hypothetical protein
LQTVVNWRLADTGPSPGAHRYLLGIKPLPRRICTPGRLSKFLGHPLDIILQECMKLDGKRQI